MVEIPGRMGVFGVGGAQVQVFAATGFSGTGANNPPYGNHEGALEPQGQNRDSVGGRSDELNTPCTR